MPGDGGLVEIRGRVWRDGPRAYRLDITYRDEAREVRETHRAGPFHTRADARRWMSDTYSRAIGDVLMRRLSAVHATPLDISWGQET